MVASVPDAFSPLRLGPIDLRNRFIKSATNEGMAKGGIVSKGLASFHERIAAGGAAMSTVAYCATSRDGRTFVDQAVLDADSLADFRVLTDGVHRHGAAASAQITHAGSFTFLDKDALKASRPLSASGGFNKVGIFSGRLWKARMTVADMAAMADEFVAAARTAKEAGFDAVELHMGHGYLLSQFVTPLYNKRRDGFGGDIERRMNFPVEVLSRVLDAVGRDMAVLVKYSMTDGPRGNGIDEGVAIARRLAAAGAHMAVLSNGLNVESISAMFGSNLPKSSAKAPNPIIGLGMWVQSLSEPKNVSFHENYLRDLALQVRGATDMPLAYIGGVQSRHGVEQAMRDGFDAVALGRALVYDANFVRDLQAGTIEKSLCNACNRCVTMMYYPQGTSCVLTRNAMDAALNTQRASA